MPYTLEDLDRELAELDPSASKVFGQLLIEYGRYRFRMARERSTVRGVVHVLDRQGVSRGFFSEDAGWLGPRYSFAVRHKDELWRIAQEIKRDRRMLRFRLKVSVL